jgi:membrane protein DedA with SNARE-associated domain
LGTIPWCFGLAGAGLALGSSWERFHEGWRYADYVVLGLVAAALVWFAVRLVQRRARRRAQERSV